VKLSRKRWQKLIDQASSLESRLEKVNAAAEAFCRILDSCTAKHVELIDAHVSKMGLASKVRVYTPKIPFSAYAPDIRYRIIHGLVASHSEQLRGKSIDDVIGAQQFMEIREANKVYGQEFNELLKQREKLLERQTMGYKALLNLTVVESIFRQRRKEKVILYIAADDEPGVLRAEKMLLGDDAPTYDESNFLIAFVRGRVMQENARKEADKEGANVYLVTSMSRMLRATLVVEHVYDRLLHDYIKINPEDHRASRLIKLQMAWMRSNSAVHATDMRPAQEAFAIRTENGQVYGVVPPGCDVSEAMINEMMQDIPAEECAGQRPGEKKEEYGPN